MTNVYAALENTMEQKIFGEVVFEEGVGEK